MARSKYKYGGAGKHGTPPKACTLCGRHHPKGKKQKKRALEKGWQSCKSIVAQRKQAAKRASQ